ncbi:hypothetical protein [Bradyrhizobium sp.]|jgi:hypothetical protein|uniref:hypothetical protein n=1 Tax=Bradyrhizobium sp. TaxID=376 RepID=UPI003C1BA3F3
MAELFASGRLVELILMIVAIEAALLLIFWRSTGRGISPGDLLPNLCAGAFLLLALRLSLGGAGWELCCGSLAGAGAFHLVDLNRRWRP